MDMSPRTPMVSKILIIVVCIVVSLLATAVGYYFYAKISRDQRDVRLLGSIAVTSRQKTSVPAELVEARILVETEDARSLSRAKAQGSAIVARIMAALHPQLAVRTATKQATSPVNSPDDKNQIKITNFTAEIRRDSDKAAKDTDAPRLRYHATYSLKIKTTQLERWPAMLQQILALGATRIDRVSFKLQDTTQACQPLFVRAATQLQQQGQQLAALTGERVVGLKALTASCSVAEDTLLGHSYSRLAALHSDSDDDNDATSASNPRQDVSPQLGQLENLLTTTARSTTLTQPALTNTALHPLEVELQLEAQWYVVPR